MSLDKKRHDFILLDLWQLCFMKSFYICTSVAVFDGLVISFITFRWKLYGSDLLGLARKQRVKVGVADRVSEALTNFLGKNL